MVIIFAPVESKVRRLEDSFKQKLRISRVWCSILNPQPWYMVSPHDSTMAYIWLFFGFMLPYQYTHYHTHTHTHIHTMYVYLSALLLYSSSSLFLKHAILQKLN